MASENAKRGVFPGLEFFTTLGTIAQKATHDIQQINRELTLPSAVNDLQIGSLWTELHIEYNTAYNQSIGVQESLSKQSSVSESLQSFHSMIDWIKVETQRIEKQLQQFGYKADDATNYEYNLPLTPQQQRIFDEEIQTQTLQNQIMEIDKNEEKETETDIDNDIDLKLTPNSPQNKAENIKKVIPTTPRTPALNDKFKLFYKNMLSSTVSDPTSIPIGDALPQTPVLNTTFDIDMNAIREQCGIPIATLDDMDHVSNGTNKMSIEDDDAQNGIDYVTEKEFNQIPQWITNQIGSINEINKIIDVINNGLKSLKGRISKAQIKDIIGQNELPVILLLTRTNRLQMDWCQGNSVYCLP